MRNNVEVSIQSLVELNRSAVGASFISLAPFLRVFLLVLMPGFSTYAEGAPLAFSFTYVEMHHDPAATALD